MRPLPLILSAILLIAITHAYEGVKTVRHAHSSSAASSNSFASSYASSGAFNTGIKGHAGAASGAATGALPDGGDFAANPAFWWANADSPFRQAHDHFKNCALKGNCAEIPVPVNVPGNGCDSNGCGFLGGFNIHDQQAGHVGAASNLGPIDISKNPFLNGEYQGIAISSCTGNKCPGGKPQTTIQTTNCKGGDCKTQTQHGSPGEIDLSGNPFLSGSQSGSSSGSFSGSYGGGGFNTGAGTGCAGVKGGCSQTGGSNQGSYGGSNHQGGSTQTTGAFGGSTQGSYGGSSNHGGSTQTTGSFGGSTQGSYGGSNNQGGSTQTAGSFGGSTQGSYGGSFNQGGSTNQGGSYGGTSGVGSGCSGVKGGCSGQTGGATHFGGSNQGSYQGSGTTSFTGTGSQTTTYPQSGHPGTDHVSQPGGHNGQTSFPQTHPTNPTENRPLAIPTTYPGQFGQTTSGQFGGSTTTSFGQPGYTSGTQHTTGGISGGSTTTSFGQPGYTSGGQHTTGSFGGSSNFGSTTNQHQAGGQPGYTNSPQGSNGNYGPTSGSHTTSGSFGGSTQFGKRPDNTGDYGSPSGIDGQLTIKCYGQGLICVKKHLCNNGIVNKNGEGLLQVRGGEVYCNVNTEVCCKLPGHSGQPHKDITVSLPGSTPGGGTYFSSTNHQSSSSAASSSSSSSSSNTNTFFSHGSTPQLPSRYSPNPNQPAGGPQPGQTIPFGGKDGTSPGVIHVLPEGENQPQPNLVHYAPEDTPKYNQPNQYGPGIKSPVGSTRPPGLTRVPAGNPTTNDLTYKDVTNEVAASSIQGPAYLPPGPSPSPSPSDYNPDLLPPNRPGVTTYIPPQPTTPRPSTYYPPPTAYQPTTSYVPPQTRPSTYYPSPSPTTGYVPPQTRPVTGYIPPVTTRRPVTNNGYLPPPNQPNQIPSESNGDNNYLPPPITNEPSDSKIININVIRPPGDRTSDGTNPRETVLRPVTDFPQNTTPYPGCAAALKCVQAEFCSAEAVISPTRVVLTKEQEINRVPTTECQDPETGIIGRCCRDPDYKDPWPASVLGQYRPDLLGFDNGQYKQPANNGRYKQPGVKGGQPQVTRPSNQQFTYEPNQIGSPSNNPNTFVRPGTYPVPNNPYNNQQVNIPVVDEKQPIDFSQKYPTSASKISGESCGIRHPNTNPVGPGPIDANFAEIPWQAMILRDTNRSLLCGGAIIRRDVVLTAAHCVEGIQANDVLVKGGEWKLGIDEEPKPFQINKVATIVRHPGYNPQNKLNDVALLILEDKFRLDKNVDTLCLPAAGEDVAKTFQNAKCITTGWGKTILQLNILNSIMHILGVGIVPSGQCQQQLQQYHSDSAYLYNANCVCGAPTQPQADICDVDVGSALACDRGDGRYTLAGVYSWDTGCNPTAQIAGYSKVDTQWIESTLQRPINDLKTEERGFYAQLQNQECHCAPGK